MRLKFDLNVGALYITLSDLAVARTQEVDDNTILDLDANGGVVGIEVISTARRWALAEVLDRYSIPPAEAAQLRAYFQSPDWGIKLESPEVSIHLSAPVSVPA
jgi:uncharacterized protein YuzE